MDLLDPVQIFPCRVYLDAINLPPPLQQFMDVGFRIDMRDSTEFGAAADNAQYRAILGGWAGTSSFDSVHRARYRDSLAALRAADRIAADTNLLEAFKHFDIGIAHRQT